MAIYNTSSDAANTAVRAFLTAVGEHYLKRSFNTGSGYGKSVWEEIKIEFGNACGYCGAHGSVQIEHLVMFNRTEYGLHHPGNIIPVCKKCNERDKDAEKKYVSWEQQLAAKNGGNESASYKAKHKKIITHINRYNYPELSDQERHAIRVIAEALYENIKTESDKSLKMYRSLDEAFVQNKQNTKS